MSFLNKTYTLEKAENFQEFMESFGLSGEELKEQIDFKTSLTIKKDGDGYILSITSPGDVIKDMKFKDGVEFDEEITPGYVAKSKLTFDGNVVTQNQKFDDGVNVTYRSEYSGDKLVTVITSNKWDGTARRYYKAA